jgi:hypothetical protein
MPNPNLELLELAEVPGFGYIGYTTLSALGAAGGLNPEGKLRRLLVQGRHLRPYS